MALKFDNVEPKIILFDGVSLDKVICDDVVVWQSWDGVIFNSNPLTNSLMDISGYSTNGYCGVNGSTSYYNFHDGSTGIQGYISSNGSCATGSKNKIDLTNFSALKANCHLEGFGTTLSIDISSLKGEYYVAIGFLIYEGKYGFQLLVCNAKTNVMASNVKVTEKSSGIQWNHGYCTKIWLE